MRAPPARRPHSEFLYPLASPCHVLREEELFPSFIASSEFAAYSRRFPVLSELFPVLRKKFPVRFCRELRRNSLTLRRESRRRLGPNGAEQYPAA